MKTPSPRLALLAALSVALGAAACLGAATRPNVLMIAIDDMNDWIGPMGHPAAKTPNLDRLARRGVVFQNAHTVGIFCAPSRAAIFTGRLPSTTGVYEETPSFVQRPDLRPLQVAFQESGYATYGTGKLYHHTAGFLDRRGWTEFWLQTEEQKRSGWGQDTWRFKGAPRPVPFPHSAYNHGKPAQNVDAGFMESAPLPDDQEEKMADTMRANWAAGVLARPHDQPFFLGVGFYAPHYPHYAPAKYFAQYDAKSLWRPTVKDDDLDDIPPAQRKARQSRKKNVYDRVGELGLLDEARLGYLACITYADAMIGRVLDALDRSPHRDNTIIVLWSDNGYHLGEKGQWGKHTLWQRTTNVPLLWAGPGLARGAKVDASVMLPDIYPTLVELCGLKPDAGLEGQSLAAALRDPAAARDRPVFTIAGPNEFSVADRQWRYIRYADGAEELYDVRRDAPEWTNLAGRPEHRAVMDRLKAAAPARFATAGKKRSEMTLVTDGENFHWEDKPPGKGGAGNSKKKK
jgi:arylsulfatase A-like enzyme